MSNKLKWVALSITSQCFKHRFACLPKPQPTKTPHEKETETDRQEPEPPHRRAHPPKRPKRKEVQRKKYLKFLID